MNFFDIVLLLICANNVKAADPECDGIRTQQICESTADVLNSYGCYWDPAAVAVGHACKAFSGDCRSIVVTDDGAMCRNAGRGGTGGISKCRYISETGKCGNVCGRLNSTDCYAEPLCFWDYAATPTARCKSCEEGTNLVCGDGYGVDTCFTNSGNSGCVKGCYYMYGSNSPDNVTKCNAATDCCWGGSTCLQIPAGASKASYCPAPPTCTTTNKATCEGDNNCYYDSVGGICKVFTNTGTCSLIKSNNKDDCVKAGNQTACKWHNGACDSSCGSLSYTTNPLYYQYACNYNQRSDCWYNSSTGECRDFDGVCATFNSNSDDCTNAGGEKTTCYYNDSVPGTPVCQNINNTVCIGFGDKSTCEAIKISRSIGATAVSVCHWNSSSCVAACDSGLLSENDCYDRSDCYWDYDTCVTNLYLSTPCYNHNSDPALCNGRADCYYSTTYSYCFGFNGCRSITYQDGCTSAKRCVLDYKNNICLDEIYVPITGILNCSAHYEKVACNADINSAGKRCLWNSNYDGQGNGLCMDYDGVAGCSAIKYPVAGGAFYSPGTDCNDADTVCAWVETDITDGECSPILGVCIKLVNNATSPPTSLVPDCYTLDRTLCERANSNCFWHDNACTVTCDYYSNSVSCYGSAVGTGATTNVPSGCVWDTGSGINRLGKCVAKECTVANTYHGGDVEKYCATLGSDCEYYDIYGCQKKCSTFSVTTCPNSYCYDSGGTCTYYPTNCTARTNSAQCNTGTNCFWFSNDRDNYHSGGCFDTYFVKNTMLRGCDDIINQEQCESYVYSAINYHTPSRRCQFIGGKCVAAVQRTLCTPLNDRIQCISNDECYWTEDLASPCREYISCGDIHANTRSYAWKNIVCNNRHGCIWDSYTKTCEVFDNVPNNVADFYNASKDCKNKGGHLVNNTCYDAYDVAGVTSCSNYGEEISCNGDNELLGGTGCGGEKGCYWDGSVCTPFKSCADIENEKTCNNKQGCYYGQGVCNKVVCSQTRPYTNCNLRKECYSTASNGNPCYPVENFPKSACERYSSSVYSNLDATKGTGEGCSGSAQACEAYLLEETCNLNGCYWDDYRKTCESGTTTNWKEYARQRVCSEKSGYWDGTNCHSSYSSSRIGNKCETLGDPLSCNYDEQSCRMGCVWNSNGSNSSCHLFLGCSSIVTTYHAHPETDCKAKPECSWVGGVCVDTNAVSCHFTQLVCDQKADCVWSVKEVTCKRKDTCESVPDSECGTNTDCWCDRHYRPPRNKPIYRCIDIQSESECGRLGPARGCYWQAAGTEFPIGACLGIPTTIACSSITEPYACSNGTEPCAWEYSSRQCVGFTDCSAITAKADCVGKPGKCAWRANNCKPADDCGQFTAENDCNQYLSPSGVRCVYRWSTDRSTGTCVQNVGCGVFVNRHQCFTNQDINFGASAPCFWKNSNNRNHGNCFAWKADAGIYGVEIAGGVPATGWLTSTTLNCSELCDESDCRNSNLNSASDTCYWHGSSGRCLPYSATNCLNITDIGICDKATNCMWNSSFDGNKGRCEAITNCNQITVTYNPLAGYDCLRKETCVWSSSSATCSQTRSCSTANKRIACAALPHCYWQSVPNVTQRLPDWTNNDNGTCTYFWGCDEIQNQDDCQEKGCGWNKKNKACGTGPKSKAKWSKGAVASTVVLAVLLGVVVVAVVVGVVILLILWRKKKVGVSNEDGVGVSNEDSSDTHGISGSSSNSSGKGNGSDGGGETSYNSSSVPLLKAEEGGASSGRGAALEQEVEDTPGAN